MGIVRAGSDAVRTGAVTPDAVAPDKGDGRSAGTAVRRDGDKAAKDKKPDERVNQSGDSIVLSGLGSSSTLTPLRPPPKGQTPKIMRFVG